MRLAHAFRHPSFRPFLAIFALALVLTLPAQAQWTLVNNPVGSYVRIQTMTTIGSTLYAGTLNGGVYTNATYANSDWKQTNQGLTDTSVSSLATMGGTLFAGTTHGMFVSSDSGAHWSAANSGLSSIMIATIFVDGSTVLAGTWGGGMYLSTDQGGSWNVPTTPPTEANVAAWRAEIVAYEDLVIEEPRPAAVQRIAATREA